MTRNESIPNHTKLVIKSGLTDDISKRLDRQRNSKPYDTVLSLLQKKSAIPPIALNSPQRGKYTPYSMKSYSLPIILPLSLIRVYPYPLLPSSSITKNNMKQNPFSIHDITAENSNILS